MTDLSLCYPLMRSVTLVYPKLPHTPANAKLYDAEMVVVSRKLKLDRKGLEPGTCGVNNCVIQNIQTGFLNYLQLVLKEYKY